MDSAELISVIVPVYKVEAYLDRCIQSVVDQSYRDLEIILVDDGSPDACPAMCERWAQRDARIRVIHKPNGGLSSARNAGMAAARGEYLTFVDSDDWIAPEMLERLLQAMDRDDSDIAACAIQLVWEDPARKEFLTVRKNCILEREEAQRALLRETLLKQPACSKLYKTDVVRDIPFELGKFHEDVFWGFQVVGKARRVSLIDYVGYFYFQRSDSIMGEGYTLKRLDALEAVERRCDYLSEHFPELASDARVSVINACIYHGQMAIRYLPPDKRKQAFSILNRVKGRYPLSREDYRDRKLSHRLWLELARFSLPLTCRIKNLLGVGL